jgi:hypothetical protein
MRECKESIRAARTHTMYALLVFKMLKDSTLLLEMKAFKNASARQGNLIILFIGQSGCASK